jgi:uncharacterized protein YkwD
MRSSETIVGKRFLLVVALALVACKKDDTTTDAPTQPSPPRATTASRSGGAETGKLAGLTAAHNRERAAVRVRALRWSNELGRYASTWANQLARNGCELVHRRDGKYGENIFWSSDPATAATVVADWVAEKSDYHHATNRCTGTCGHFTQVVWQATTKLGCGTASCPGGGEIWVCNYDPPGNVMGQSPY